MKKLSLLLLLCLSLSAQAQVDSLQQDSIVRILAIGNSFSQDAVEQYLWELADEAGIKMVIGNAYRGGQGFQSHWIDVTEANNTFEYRKVVNGRRSNRPRSSLESIITDEPWQFITFQQVSQESGLTTTFEPDLTHLIQYAQSLQTNPNAVYGYHQRKLLFGVLLRVLMDYMPRVEPELISGYPGSLEKIELLFAQTIVEAVARVA